MKSKKQIELKEFGFVSLILFLLVTIFLWKFFFLGQTLLPADIINIRYPWKVYFLSSNYAITEPHNNLIADSVMVHYPNVQFFYNSLRNGIMPLWNPYIYAGNVFEGIPWLSFPANMPFLFLPPQIAFGYCTALRLFLAGILMYFFMRTIGSKVLGSFIAAMVFMFNLNTITWLSFPTHLNTELWIPLIFLLLAKTISQKKISFAILTGGALGLHMLSGYLQLSLYFMLALLLFFLWMLLIDYPIVNRLRELQKLLFLYSLIVLIGLLIGAMAIIPFKENIDLSIRAHQARGAGPGYPLLYLITFFIPNFFGNPAHHNFWGIWGNYTEMVKYLGILPLILALIAITFRKAQSETRRYSDFFLILALLTFLSALGEHSPLHSVLALIPYFYTSNVIRILSLFTFSIAVLSGLGGDLLEKSGDELRDHLLKFVKILFIIIPCFVTFFILLVIVKYPNLMRNLLSPTLINYEIMNILLLLFWTAASFFLLILFINKKHRKLRRYLFTSFILLILLDLFVAGIDYNSYADPATVYPATESTNFLSKDQSLYRILPVGGFATFIPNSAMVYEISSIGGYSPLCRQRYWEYISLIDGAGITANGVLYFTKYTKSKLIDILNVKYVVAPPNEDLIAHELKKDVVQDRSNVLVGEIYGSNTHGQTFISHHSNLKAISIMLATYKRINNLNTTFHLKDSPLSESDIVTINLNNSQVEDNSYHTFGFPPIIDSENRSFYFYLESAESLPGNAISISFSSTDSYSEGERYVNDIPSQGDLRFITFHEESNDLTLVYNGEVKIYKNLNSLPRAFVVHQMKVIEDKERVLNELNNEEFDPMKYIILEENITNEMLNDKYLSEESSMAEVIDYSPNKVVVNANMSYNGFLILADTYDSNWEVFVDGKKDKIYVADYILRAVYLNKGMHVIEYVYYPKIRITLSYLSISILITITAIVLITIYSPKFFRVLKSLKKSLRASDTK